MPWKYGWRWLEGWMGKEEVGNFLSRPGKSKHRIPKNILLVLYFWFKQCNSIQRVCGLVGIWAWLLDHEDVTGPSVNRENSPSSSLSGPLSPPWPSFWFFLTLAFPSPPLMHQDPAEGSGEKWRILRMPCLRANGKVRLERIVLVPFCIRIAYDSFSALSYKLWNVATPLLLFMRRQPASQKCSVGGQVSGNPSCHVLFILIHLNGVLLTYFLKSIMQLEKLDTS